MICKMMDPEDLPSSQDLSVIVFVGFFSALAGHIRIVSEINIVVFLIPGFICAIILLVFVFVGLLAIINYGAK